METSFAELRDKQVINVLSGRLLGHVCDVVLDLRRNCILGFVVPGCKSFFNIFKPNQELFIPLNCICKVGEDVILVEVIEPGQKKPKKNVRIFDANERSISNKNTDINSNPTDEY
ncbi:MAG: YlmC/YmxH family sporulation protein [Clostridia bacterium]|nr:YlmC/YmxH family sporulation protein [Clostridia bacterium]